MYFSFTPSGACCSLNIIPICHKYIFKKAKLLFGIHKLINKNVIPLLKTI